METNAFRVTLDRNQAIAINVIPGHFTTANAHVNYFLDLWELKTNISVAREVAVELAAPYLTSTPIDIIMCLERTVVLGTFTAEELRREGTAVMNTGSSIHVISPLSNINGNLIFQDNAIEWIQNKNVLLILASILSGETIEKAKECIEYYGGRLAGISSLFCPSETIKYDGNTLFTAKDIPGYKVYRALDCEMCKIGQKLDAIITSEGYTKLIEPQQ